MTSFPRKITIQKAAFLAAFFILSPGFLAKADTVDVPGDALVTSIAVEPSNLIPFLATDSASAQVSKLIFNGLLKYDPQSNLIGDLAESWEVLDGGLRIIFHLRKNVFWHDGVKFTADDVEFTFLTIIDPKTPTPYSGDFEKVKLVKVLDDYTFEVSYKEIFSPGLSSWCMGIVPKHAMKNQDVAHTHFSRCPVGTGPFYLERWDSGRGIYLRANPKYYEGQPGIRRFIFRILPDSGSSFLEALTGKLDLLSLTPLQFRKMTDTPSFKKPFDKYRYPSPAYLYLGYNLENSLFKDVRVRNAINLALDKKEILRVAFMDCGRVATGPFLPGSAAFDDKVRSLGFNPKKSAALLKKAGFGDSNHDGILDKDGKSFSFTLLTNQGDEQRKLVCQMIQKYLKDIGIQARIEVLDWSLFLNNHIDKKNFDAVVLAWQLGQDPDIFDIFHSSKTAPGQFNFVSFKNARADKLLEEARREFDPAKRARISHRIHRLLNRLQPYTFLVVPDTLVGVDKRFKGVRLTPAGIGYDLIRWTVNPQDRKYRT